ncbi:flagellar hook-basal body complex protein FliE [Fodinibius halophilus]|uniref:Flagellar hook-basal body complex protein FliE n=1 Tax=Fodinibius halophilus TaxID=1736908 RepID=A0A6M1T2F0_9BACT|nr:flagellar hook-basal body complex protein FliE [Fodinibius halophilus]NGP87405.1 flagellar hook-basal body complex protein FliE [Fodinibius halophilus]
MIEGIQASEIIKQANEIELSPERQEIQTEKGDKASFANVLTDAINSVDETMKTSDKEVQKFISGESDNVHDVMISMQRAKLSFDLMVEVRNKAVETYQEVSRMQI